MWPVTLAIIISVISHIRNIDVLRLVLITQVISHSAAGHQGLPSVNYTLMLKYTYISIMLCAIYIDIWEKV